MGSLFKKKVVKTPEEIKKEREEKTIKTTKLIKTQISQLERKKENLIAKAVEARSLNLPQNEEEIKKSLKATMASIKKEQSMLLSLELAVENRDLAEINLNFLELVGDLSEDIIDSGKKTSAKKANKVKERYTRAMFVANQQQVQNDQIIDTIANSSLAASIGDETNKYSEFDDEIDKMIDNAEVNMNVSNNTNSYTNKIR